MVDARHLGHGEAVAGTVDDLHRVAGRDPKTFGIEGRMTLSQVPEPEWAKEMDAWRAMRGIPHLCIPTTGLGLARPADHVETLRRFRKVAGLT